MKSNETTMFCAGKPLAAHKHGPDAHAIQTVLDLIGAEVCLQDILQIKFYILCRDSSPVFIAEIEPSICMFWVRPRSEGAPVCKSEIAQSICMFGVRLESLRVAFELKINGPDRIRHCETNWHQAQSRPTIGG